MGEGERERREKTEREVCAIDTVQAYTYEYTYNEILHEV